MGQEAQGEVEQVEESFRNVNSQPVLGVAKRSTGVPWSCPLDGVVLPSSGGEARIAE